MVEDRTDILPVFTNKCYRRFKKDPNISSWQAVSLSEDISDEDNELLIIRVSEEAVWQAVKQTGPLKAPGLNEMHVNFLYKMLEDRR